MEKLTAIFMLSLFLFGCAGKTVQPVNETNVSSSETKIIDETSSGSQINEEKTEAEATQVAPEQTGLIREQILAGAEGDIHYSYYLPETYDPSKQYPMMVVMPGYDMMWFGEDSSGCNVNWNGFLSWTKLDTGMIVVSAQLTDWHEKSARQAIELTEYFIDHFSVDTGRIYAAGYSAGGETMSQAVSMRPDLYAAYLHGASQWDGSYEPIAENKVAVFIYIAEGDEYYGSEKARFAYENLHAAYENAGWSEDEIDQELRLEIPDNSFFNEQGIYNYHGGANVLFNDPDNLNWILSHTKEDI